MGDNDRRTVFVQDKVDVILSYLRSSQRPAQITRKTIQKHLNSNVQRSNDSAEQNNISDINTTTAWSKRDVKHALKRLVKRGDIVKNGKEYSCNITDNNGEEGDVPIAQRMRRKKTHQSEKNDETINSKEPPTIDLDEEIKRLEEELAEESQDDDDDVDESDNEIDESDVDSKDSKSNDVVDDNQSNGIIRLSDLANDRIEPLPPSALPQSRRRHLKGVDAAANQNNEIVNISRKKQRKSQNEQGEHTVSEGLKHAVQDLLQNYIRPSQLDRPPFYCRICQHQATSQSEFDLHRASEFHKVAVKEEQKKTYCKLCRKQLTSIIQMEEHLTSKPHRDRMDFVKGKQRGSIRNSVGSGGDDGRRGRGVTGNTGQSQRGFVKRDRSGRQWC